MIYRIVLFTFLCSFSLASSSLDFYYFFKQFMRFRKADPFPVPVSRNIGRSRWAWGEMGVSFIFLLFHPSIYHLSSSPFPSSLFLSPLLPSPPLPFTYFTFFFVCLKHLQERPLKIKEITKTSPCEWESINV